MVNCEICKEQFGEDRSLHAHLKTHKMRVIEYYQSYVPRFDLFDGSIIKFKSKDQYLNTDFNTVASLRKWLESKPREEAKEYCKNLLRRRKERKKLIYAPTQVDLRSLKFPGVNYYNEIFGNYYQLCSELGLRSPYKKYEGESFDSEFKPEHIIFVDSREQRKLEFEGVPIEIKALKFGDYSLNDIVVSSNTYIERKSMADLIGTLSGGLERFKREISRSIESQAKLIILVEENLKNCLDFRNLPNVYKKNTRVNPEYIFRNVRDLLSEFNSIQFLFVDGRLEASRVIKKILLSGASLQEYDLQSLYDVNKL